VLVQLSMTGGNIAGRVGAIVDDRW